MMHVCLRGGQASTWMNKTSAILVIGNEILTGKVEETNATYLTKQLYELGVTLRGIQVVPDEIDAIAGAVRALRPTVDTLFTSGGVGPTHDDVTVHGIAKALGREVVLVEPIAKVLRHYYGDKCNDDVLRMAEAPAGYELIECCDRYWPVLAVENIVILPGVPEIFRRKFYSIRERFRSTPFAMEILHTSLDEGLLAAHLNKIAAAYPAVAIGSYPQFTDPSWKVRVTLESKDADAVVRATRDLKTALGDTFVDRAP